MNKQPTKTYSREQQVMERTFIRNYSLFLCLLVLCSGTLIYTLIIGNDAIGRIDDSVRHVHDVIADAQQLATSVESMIVAQRGYIITNQKPLLDNYYQGKDVLAEKIAHISHLVSDNPSQIRRIQQMQAYKDQLTDQLEDRAVKYSAVQNVMPWFFDDIEVIGKLRENILSLNNEVLEEEYSLLNQRIRNVNDQKVKYFNFLLIGVVTSSALLLLFNGFLLRSQRKRIQIEAMLQDRERRFALAVEGTQDGIYDWDLVAGEVFYSSRIFGMLGHVKRGFVGTIEDLKEVMHPEDGPMVWKVAEDYFSELIPEYSVEFRLKCVDGRWLWVNSRGRAIRNAEGKPLRLVGAHTDISLIKERQEKLEHEKRAAEDANRAKSDFLAHMSHEIRTPLTAISGIAEIFASRQANLDDKQKKLVSTLSSSTAALKDLINDILDFSKIESRELELAQEDFHLGRFFEEIVGMMSLRAQKKAISFVFGYEDLKNSIFCGDKARLRQILINLIGNGIKFTDTGGVKIIAYAEKRGDQNFLRVDVADTGIGIDPENFDLVFERFKQADHGVARKYGGTGLGLSISKNLAELMGGKIILSSQTGKGSTFSLLLPDNHGKLAVLPEKKSLNGLNPSYKIRPSALKDKKVLIVEDYEANVTVIGFILEDLGCAYDVARNGQEAFNMWKETVYDLILMDVQMPTMDGFSATAAIRKAESKNDLPHTSIIGMTAHALVGDKDKCIESGMDSYLSKPVFENDLREEIFKYIGQEREAA